MDLRTEADEGLTLDAERAIPLALVLAELVEAAVRRAADGSAPEWMRLAAREDGGAVMLELTDAGGGGPADAEDAPEPRASDLGDKVVRALTRQIGAVLRTEDLPCGSFRTTLSLPAKPAKPGRS
jgi:two-component sensor histidine kinase